MALNPKTAPTFLVLGGEGINCERETARALETAGVRAKIIPLSLFLKQNFKVCDYHGLVLPGGFSFGDELGSGQILALKMRHLKEDFLAEFVRQKRPILGICNGFQVLTKLGLLPGALVQNQNGRFINRWVELKAPHESICVWTRGLSTLRLPIRHGEGRLVLNSKVTPHIALQYTEDVNGSDQQIAGLTDPSGLILGLMPHPEAATRGETYPSRELLAPGKRLFENIANYLRQS